MLRVAIQGTHGAFHELAALKFYGRRDIQFVYCDTFSQVFSNLAAGQADASVVAVGNSRFGDISRVYDILIRNHLKKSAERYWIVGEVYHEIEQCLVGIKSTILDEISEVHSQAPALGQCTKFLHAKLPNAKLVEQDDTAKSAQLVSLWQDPTKVAIASRHAAEIYGLHILKTSIQDDKHNTTRFLVIEKNGQNLRADDDKCSLLLKTTHLPGSLAKALMLFSDLDLNLSYLQSVPVPEELFKYRFYIDVEAGAKDPRMQKVVQALQIIGYEIDILGSYRQAKIV